MTLENFQNKCREAKEKEDITRSYIVDRHNSIKQKQSLYKEDCYKPKWKGFIFEHPYCPHCGEVLSIEIVNDWGGKYSDMILTCDCGYEYAW